MKTFFAFLFALLVAPFVVAPHQEPDDSFVIVTTTFVAEIGDDAPDPIPDEWFETPEPSPAVQAIRDKYVREAEECQCGDTCRPGCRCGCVWTYERTQSFAKSTGRPMLVVVCTDACPPCRALEATMADPGVAQVLAGYAVAKVHRRRDDAPWAEVSDFPTLIVSAPGGVMEMTRRTGAMDKAALINLLRPASAIAPQAAPFLIRPAQTWGNYTLSPGNYTTRGASCGH